jgi:peptidoglycan/LPS O-acetylase OafA/YrhL
MFGVLRTVLALMVVCQHLLNLVPLGQYAVFCFYVISGYLMTLIMQRSYGYTLRGRYRFVTNRFLRLYPMYWFIIGLTALLILFVGGKIARNYNPSLYLPSSNIEALANIFMTFPSWNPISFYPRLVPPAWALTVELFFYLLICLGISKTFGRVRIWFFVSLAYVVVTYVLGWDDNERYFPIAAGSLPFSIGAGIYFYSKGLVSAGIFSKANIPARRLFVLLVLNAFAGLYLFNTAACQLSQELAFYANLALSLLLVYKIASGDRVFGLNGKADGLVGDFSYPIYLSHWQANLLVSFLLFGKPIHKLSTRGMESFLVSLVIMFILAGLLILLVDKPIQRLREKIKN